jgi:hypothetical protein
MGRYNLNNNAEERPVLENNQEQAIRVSVEPMEVAISFDPESAVWNIKTRKKIKEGNKETGWSYVKATAAQGYRMNMEFQSLDSARQWCTEKGLTP